MELNQRRRAKALGISRTWVQVLELRAMNKFLLAVGRTPRRIPRWMRQYADTGTVLCGQCSRGGHNARSCQSPGVRIDPKNSRLTHRHALTDYRDLL